MNKELSLKVNIFGAWSGVVYMLALFVGWWVVGGFFPPHSPSNTAEEVAIFYQENGLKIKVGLILVMLGTGFFLPFTATIADFVSKFEGRVGPLTHTTLLAGFGNAVLTFYPPMWWLINAFRPNKSTELMLILNDAAWLQFIGGIGLFLPIFIVIAFVALKDESPDPVFPRWFGYLSIWVFLLFLPDQLLFFFTSGPFAWNGIVGYWIPVFIFGTWFITIACLMRRKLIAELRATSNYQI